MTAFSEILDRLQYEDATIPDAHGERRRFDFAEVEANGNGEFALSWDEGRSIRVVRIGLARTETEIAAADFVDRVRYAP